MNSEDFEKRLERQTIRPIPGEWRHEILQAANPQRDKAPCPALKTQNSKLTTFLSDLLWPCPQAWVGLAAVWAVIFVLDFNSQEANPEMAKSTPPSPEVIAEIKEQRRLYLELAGLQVKEVAEPPKIANPGPRSERKQEYQFV